MATYGMYGGKFMPMHKGHELCVQKALESCDFLHVILFINSADEQQIMFDNHKLPSLWYSVPKRVEQLYRLADKYDGRVIPHVIDVGACRMKNAPDVEDWDMETALVLGACGHFDYVYGSEPDYGNYFGRAYPWAEYKLIDVNRNEVPISATKVREMFYEDAREWMV